MIDIGFQGPEAMNCRSCEDVLSGNRAFLILRPHSIGTFDVTGLDAESPSTIHKERHQLKHIDICTLGSWIAFHRGSAGAKALGGGAATGARAPRRHVKVQVWSGIRWIDKDSFIVRNLKTSTFA